MQHQSKISVEQLQERSPEMHALALKLAKEAYGDSAILPENITVQMECGKVVGVPIPEEKHKIELCNNCGQYAPKNEINFAGFCKPCQA